MFWKEFIPRKTGLKPSTKVREAPPEHKAPQGRPTAPCDRAECCSAKAEDNRSHCAGTDLAPWPHTNLVGFMSVPKSGLCPVVTSHPAQPCPDGAADVPPCHLLPGPAVPSQGHAERRSYQSQQILQGTRTLYFYPHYTNKTKSHNRSSYREDRQTQENYFVSSSKFNFNHLKYFGEKAVTLLHL